MLKTVLILNLLISIKISNCAIIENGQLNENKILPKIEEILSELIIEDFSNLRLNQEFNKNESYIEDKLEAKRYDGAQLWRILVNEDEQRDTINKLKKQFDGQTWMDINNNIDILLKEEKLKDAENLLKSSNLSHVILIDDLQKAIESENPPKEEIEILQNRKGHRMTWIAYHRIDDIHGYLDYLAKTYPDLCSVETIGYSSQNRALKLLKISNQKSTNRKIFIDGGMHAREWISPATVTYIIEQLTENWEDLPPFMRSIDWYILPVVNPDGYEYTHQYDRLWRKTRSRAGSCSGVDLNRNFGHNWGGAGTSASSCSDIYRGTRAFSEPESSAMASYMSKFGMGYFKGYITFHSYGQYVLYPYGHKKVFPPDHKDLDRVGREGAAKILRVGGASYTVGSSATTLYEAAGGSDDWLKATLGVKYTYTVEMRDTGRYGFILPANYIVTSGKEGMAFTETVAKYSYNL